MSQSAQDQSGHARKINIAMKYKYFMAAIIAILFIFIYKKDSVFREFPTLAVLYSDDDLLTSRRKFSSGKVWKIRVGNRFVIDARNIEETSNGCKYKKLNDSNLRNYEEYLLNTKKEDDYDVYIVCEGSTVAKYFKIEIIDGIIVEIDLTVSAIGTI